MPSLKPNGIVPFQVDFKKNGIDVSSKEQAIIILDEVAKLHAHGAKTVGITYSANQSQTDKILDTYRKGDWQTGTIGSNQASVIFEIEKLLTETKYQHLQGVYRTIPITTMKYSNGRAMTADDPSVQKSIEHASEFMANGGMLLGWRNQSTPQGHLAIGGGVAANVQTLDQKHIINKWVQSHLLQ
ncbi:hypothetical protein Lsai_1747 [Legionella sainthelensi]|uniref:Uncharacterized protein n=1 Tax=Legionella sainthelensi TaxID=28087 RepID=A0A0W0YJW6_9GAMM|nr:hypothetical protein [Legionella sainthelensi]KTD57143.1 hypothetical protein Lsai_1747 [Legionella sainthelensi]VEH37577.1 Uncharacterised protein [Legionella sainthelensi]